MTGGDINHLLYSVKRFGTNQCTFKPNERSVMDSCSTYYHENIVYYLQKDITYNT